MGIPGPHMEHYSLTGDGHFCDTKAVGIYALLPFLKEGGYVFIMTRVVITGAYGRMGQGSY